MAREASGTRGRDLYLDTEALRQLLTRSELAGMLWSGDIRKYLQSVLRNLHGEAGERSLARHVSTQALHTWLNALMKGLDGLFDEDGDSRAREVLEHVGHIFSLKGKGSKGIKFKQVLVLALTEAALHASLKMLINTQQSNIKTRYREVVDFIRQAISSEESFTRVEDLKNRGIKLIKKVVAHLSNSDKRDATLKVKAFVQQHPLPVLERRIKEQTRGLVTDMRSLWMREKYAQPHRSSDPRHRPTEKSRNAAGKRKRRSKDPPTPDFFSDVEGGSDSSRRNLEDEEFESSVRTDGHKEGQDETSRDDSQLADNDTVTGQRKKPRRSREHGRELPRSSAHAAHRKSGEAGDTRPLDDKDVDIRSELDEMKSQVFSATDSALESIDHIVRHARSRGPRTRSRGRDSRRKGASAQVHEESSPSFREGSEGYDSGGNDEDSHDSSLRVSDEIADEGMGSGGAVLRELHETATNLQNAGPPDPLEEAVADAGRAKRRRRRSIDPAYSPGAEAREASPFPSDSPESVLDRKKKTNLQLDRSPMKAGTKMGKTKSAMLSKTQMFGKTCRVGRFEPYEDDLLLKGLETYGWGAWKDISGNFGDGEYTRAPVSLKDRARTMNLDPEQYPVQETGTRGRPRGSTKVSSGQAGEHGKSRSREGLNGDEDAEAEEAQDAEDPIVHPDATQEDADES